MIITIMWDCSICNQLGGVKDRLLCIFVFFGSVLWIIFLSECVIVSSEEISVIQGAPLLTVLPAGVNTVSIAGYYTTQRKN